MEIISEIVNWAKKYNLKLNMESLEGRVFETSFDVDQSLIWALEAAGANGFGDQGCPPDEYLPFLASTFIGLVEERSVTFDSVTSDDDWNSAKISFNKSDTALSVLLTDVDGSSWVPESLYREIEKLSREHCDKVLFSLHGEDSFLVIYLSESAISDLNVIRESLPLPEWMRPEICE